MAAHAANLSASLLGALITFPRAALQFAATATIATTPPLAQGGSSGCFTPTYHVRIILLALAVDDRTVNSMEAGSRSR